MSGYVWDADLVREDLRQYVIEHLDDGDAVVVVDETGFITAARRGGSKTLRSGYSWPMPRPRAERCWTVSCTCPRCGLTTRERRREAGVPESVGFRTKGQLARQMLQRAVESELPFAWFTGDQVYDSDRRLRLWLEQEGVPHVLAIKRSERLWALTDRGPRQARANRLAAQVDEADWVRCSAGDGAKGPRVYDWAAVEIRPLRESGKGHWLLARRNVAKPGGLAYYVCYGPSGTALEELVRVAGRRWTIEECFEEAKGQVGLDQYEVRRRDGWYRHITLAMLAHAYLAIIRNQAAEQGKRGPLRPR